MKRLFAILMSLVLAAALACPAFAASDVITTARHGIAVVAVGVQVGDQWQEAGWGTGFFVGEKNQPVEYLITNHHVVEYYLENGAGELLVGADASGATVTGRAKVRVYFDSQDFVEAYVMDFDAVRDLALVRLSAATDKRAALTLCSPTDDMVGDTVYTVGYPGISDSVSKESTTSRGESDATVSTGVVSRISTVAGTGVGQILTDAEIRHGNSGGPMVNERAQVLGVNTYSVSNTEGEQANYAVNIDEALAMLNANNVPYTMASSIPWVVWLVAGLAAAAVVVVVVVLLVTRRKKAVPVAVAPPAPSVPSVPSSPALRDSGYRLQGVAGALEGKRYAIPASGQLILGRDPARCTVTMPSGTAGVSACHCAVWVENGELYLKDLGSTHGTFVSPGSRLGGGQAIRIRPGEAFWLGSQAQTFVVAERRPG